MLAFCKKIVSKAYVFVFNITFIGEALTMFHGFFLHLRFSFSDRDPGLDKERLEYYLVKHCHIVEKGLALPEPRKGFGQPKITKLIIKMREYEKYYGVNQIGFMVRDTLREYLKFHEDDLKVFPNDFLSDIKGVVKESPAQAKGGLKHLRKSEMVTLGGDLYESFLRCRHSVRNYSEVAVDDSVIIDAIAISQNTPSVCNRQGWLVHYYSDTSKIQELLSFQNGNAGFTESIDKLLIVTGSVKAFTRYEHNQLFIDGGLYSMNLMLALHAVGLGSCPLNTCMHWIKAKKMKKAAGIAHYEQVIMMIAVGNLLDEFSVAQSEKYPVEKFVWQH